MRRKSIDSHFHPVSIELQCCTEVISGVPQDISVKAIHREMDFNICPGDIFCQGHQTIFHSNADITAQSNRSTLPTMD